MLSNSGIATKALIWVLLTIFIMLALLGAAVLVVHQKATGGTCGSIGGEWVETEDQFICIIYKKGT